MCVQVSVLVLDVFPVSNRFPRRGESASLLIVFLGNNAAASSHSRSLTDDDGVRPRRWTNTARTA